MGLLTNWTGAGVGLAKTVETIKALAAGFMIPFVLLPESIKNILNIFPFRYIFSFSLELLLGQLSWQAVLFGYFILIVWCGLLIFTFNLLSDMSMKLFSSYGG
jgi:ABC-type uncharacterized transport system permease subunit